MHSFSILNSRKRAIIALIHTVVFLCVAALQAALSHHPKEFSLGGDKVVGGAISAACGLLRILPGDPLLHTGIVRVCLLSAAAIVGFACTRPQHLPPNRSILTETINEKRWSREVTFVSLTRRFRWNYRSRHFTSDPEAGNWCRWPFRA